MSDTAHGSGTVGQSFAGVYGHLTLNSNGSYSYAADIGSAIAAGATGSHLVDTFSYTVSDGNGGTATATLAVTLDRPPVVAETNVDLAAGHASVAVSSLFAASDPDGDAIVTYGFIDSGPGELLLNGVPQAHNQEVDVSAAQLSQLVYQSAPQSIDMLEIRASDGAAWSSWSSVAVTAPPVVIQTDTSAFGTTSLTGVGYGYFLDGGSGSGPALSYEGAPVTVGEFAAPWNWTPIGAVETATGYDIALHVPGADEYTVWSTDSSGNYLSNLVGAVSGTTAALESFESIFNQNLNGADVIGLYAAPSSTLQVNTATTVAATIGAGASLELDLMDSGSVTFAASTGMLKLDGSSTFSGEIFNFSGNGTLAGSDQIDLANINYNSAHDTYSDGVLSVADGTNTDQLHFNGSYVLANFSFASDGSGGTIVYDPPVLGSASVDASIDPSPGTNKAQSNVTKAPSSGTQK